MGPGGHLAQLLHAPCLRGRVRAIRLIAGKYQRLSSRTCNKVSACRGIVHTYWQSAICLATGTPPGPMGSAHPLNAPYQAFQTADGWITIGAANQGNWLRLLDVIEAPHLASDPRFDVNAHRMQHLAELEAELTPFFVRRSSQDWLDRLDAAGVPAGPVLDVAQMHQHPQARARQMVLEVEHSRVGPVTTLGLPVKFSATPGAVRHGAPIYGEHSRAILAEHGFGAEEVARLIAAGTVVAADEESGGRTGTGT